MRAAGIVAIHPLVRRGTMCALSVLTVLTLCCAGIACNRATSEPEVSNAPPEKMELAWEEGPIPGAPAATPMVVKEGPAPLLYLSERAATLQVVDRSGGDRVLAKSAVGPRTIVLVDTQRGVVFGGQTLVAGPLAGRRRYAIYLIPRGENVSRSGVSVPVEVAEEEAAEETTRTVTPPPPRSPESIE